MTRLCSESTCVLIRGELCGMQPDVVTGAGLRPGAKAPEPPPDPDATASAARSGVTPDVNAQQSAEAIVVECIPDDAPAKGRTR